ncbi:hypothetical protein F4810DRAFT_678918 [Camillea tinctor]|nr:hypothetical protein F4810DRAFT_678918 [Camillea tinctor]
MLEKYLPQIQLRRNFGTGLKDMYEKYPIKFFFSLVKEKKVKKKKKRNQKTELIPYPYLTSPLCKRSPCFFSCSHTPFSSFFSRLPLFTFSPPLTLLHPSFFSLFTLPYYFFLLGYILQHPSPPLTLLTLLTLPSPLLGCYFPRALLAKVSGILRRIPRFPLPIIIINVSV